VQNGGSLLTLVWDVADLTAMLLEAGNADLLQAFLPASFQRITAMSTLENAILLHQDRLPPDVLGEVLRLVKPYSETWLTGVSVWPFDSGSAKAIDGIVRELLVELSPTGAVRATENIEYDAFAALVKLLVERHPRECEHYLRACVREHDDYDLRFNAAQTLFETFEIQPVDQLNLARCLDSDGLVELYGEDVTEFVQTELIDNGPNYAFYSSVDELSSSTSISEVYIDDLRLAPNPSEGISFEGHLVLALDLSYDGEPLGHYSADGEFAGYFDANGMYLEEADVDTDSFYK
jgi:hypothetical protein